MTDAPSANQPPTYPTAHGLLAGKVVLVTAAAGTGIGFATAQRAVEEGATVVISDAHERRLGEAAEKLAELAGAAPLAVPCDVTDEGQVQALFAAAAERHGDIDVVVCNAGLGGTAEVAEMTDEQWAKVLDVTLTGTFRSNRAAVRHMYERGRGIIVNNASVLGWRAQAGQSHYAAAKAGVMALTRLPGDGGGAARRPGERGLAEHRDAPVPGQGVDGRAPRRADEPGGVRPGGGAVGGGQRDRLLGQRVLELHDGRGRERE